MGAGRKLSRRREQIADRSGDREQPGIPTGKARDLQTQRQADLFTGVPQESRLDATVDGIRERFGKSLLTRASLLPRTPSGGSRHG